MIGCAEHSACTFMPKDSKGENASGMMAWVWCQAATLKSLDVSALILLDFVYILLDCQASCHPHIAGGVGGKKARV